MEDAASGVNDPSLVSLARAELEDAKTWFRLRLYAHIATLVVVLGAQYAPEKGAYVLGLIALVLQVIAWALRRRALSRQALGEEAKRRALLADALGVEAEPREAADIRARMSKAAVRAAASMDDLNYYASKRAPGLLRLRDHLQESTFWSKHLYEAAAQRASLAILPLITVPILILFFLAPFATGSTIFITAKVLLVAMSFVPSSDQLSNSFAWSSAARKCDQLDRRVDSIAEGTWGPALAVFADYALATGTAPPIPTKIYEARRDELNRQWDGRMQSNGKEALPDKSS